jgi:23S rRNA (uracil1939-C5)-methyltransferase
VSSGYDWLEVESLDLEAQGVARRPDGKVVFIEGALPGERVQVQVAKKKNAWEQGPMSALSRESAQRVRPGCPHFGLHAGACGGCKMQHLHPAAQVAVKQRVLEDNLLHLAKVVPERMLRAIHGPAWGYRYRARLSVRYVAKKGTVLIGFHERQSELAAGDTVVALVLRHLEPLGDADAQRLRVFARQHGVQWWLQPGGPDTVHRLDEEGPVLAYALPEFGVQMPFRPTDFTQVNPHINRVLVQRAVRMLGVEPGQRVIDWFCGLGNFTLPLATLAREVLGVEGSETLVQRARANAALNGLGVKARFEAENLFEIGVDGLRRHGEAERWLVDPPREGAFALAKGVADAHAAGSFVLPQRIVYVSCNPATLARDAGLLVHQGGYRCTAAGVVNMFPHTAHVESMAVFERG